MLGRRLDVEVELRAGEREGAGNQLAVLGEVRSPDRRVPRKGFGAVDRDEAVQPADRQPDGRLALGAFNSGCTPRVRAVHIEWE